MIGGSGSSSRRLSRRRSSRSSRSSITTTTTTITATATATATATTRPHHDHHHKLKTRSNSTSSSHSKPQETSHPTCSSSVEQQQRSSSSSSSSPEWEAIEILREARNRYYIKWAGINPETGRSWPPSWEPKRNANQVLVDDWNQKRRKRQTNDPSQTPTHSTTTNRRTRRRRRRTSSTRKTKYSSINSNLSSSSSPLLSAQLFDETSVQVRSNQLDRHKSLLDPIHHQPPRTPQIKHHPPNTQPADSVRSPDQLLPQQITHDPENRSPAILLAPDSDEPSPSPQKTQPSYVPDQPTADLIASLNDLEDPNHKRNMIAFLCQSSIDKSDQKLLSKFIINPCAYLADPSNEILRLRKAYCLGQYFGFELQRTGSGSVCLWLELDSNQNPRYLVKWDDVKVRQELAKILFTYTSGSGRSLLRSDTPDHARVATTPIPEDASMIELVHSQAPRCTLGASSDSLDQYPSRSSLLVDPDQSSLLSHSSSRDETILEPSPSQHQVLQTEVEPCSSSDPSLETNPVIGTSMDEIPSVGASMINHPSSSQDPRTVTHPESQQTPGTIVPAQIRIEELENAVATLRALLAGALDVNAGESARQSELEERQVGLMEEYERKLDQERTTVVELERRLREKEVEITGQRALLMQSEDTIAALESKIKGLECMLKESKHPAKQVYDRFREASELERTRLRAELGLARKTIDRLEIRLNVMRIEMGESTSLTL